MKAMLIELLLMTISSVGALSSSSSSRITKGSEGILLFGLPMHVFSGVKKLDGFNFSGAEDVYLLVTIFFYFRAKDSKL